MRGLTLLLCAMLGPVSAMAGAYECLGPSGDRIFTDDPQSFANCTPLDIGKGDAPKKPFPSATNPSPKTVPKFLPEPVPSADDKPSSSPDASRSSDLLYQPDPEYAPLPRVVAPETQTCAKDINRLNPFGSAPCQPRAGSPPVAVPYEDYYR